ncbi:peptidase S24 [Pandoraea pnomenusa]|uniref:Uncharacterized HTH-type transcriptional regulator CBU_1416 n=1 Tax=Pandoraea pnomenusa TaxID=93220 RepID=A0A378YZX3_9BURK|nr:XRE family transcriptional regulator [Pandoraea pnomenusa]AIU29335.1 peptidase S24 [Pandoraea pnomenusa]SUA81979.1 Uncharacterized HTH-type transcriptional regulator CBU_1416 [Pandoraea pnomenusa]
MSTLAERLTECFEDSGAKPAELARACGIKQPSINDWMSGRTKNISGENLLLAAQFFKVNPWWLATGKGHKTLDGGTSGIGNVMPAPIGQRRIPLISSVQAGRMTEALEPFPPGAAFEYLLTDLDLSDHAFALEIEGQSMEPDFKEGDRIIVDPALQPQPGDFVVAKNGREEATFKKYRPRGIGQGGREVFELVPLNDDYPTINSEHEPARIIGVMVEHRRYRRR